MKRVHWYNASTTISVGHHHAGSVNFEEKRRFVKSIRHLKRSYEKVRWRCRAGLKGGGPGQFLLEGPYDVIHDVILCKSCVFAG